MKYDLFDVLVSDEGKKVVEEARDFIKSIPRQYVLDMDKDEIVFPKEFLAEAGKRNLLGAKVSKKYGGRGFNWVDQQPLTEEIGTLGYIFSCTFGVGPDLVCDAIEKWGSEMLKQKYIVPLLKGEMFAAECLTEPRGGSDFFGASTTAEKKGNNYILNGQKRFIVGGEGADYYFVYARTNLDPDAHPHKCISAFLVDKQPGVEVSYLYGLMGCRGGGAARLTFNNAIVPEENLLGTLHGGYDIFNTMMIPERLGTACMTIGSVRPAIDIATDYTTKRKQFGKVIRKYQGVSFQLADAVALVDNARAACHVTCRAVDGGLPLNEVRRLISQSKKFTTESCQEAARLSMQVMGGIGYTNVYPVERIVRDLGLASIWTGTSEVMNMIAASEWYKKYNRYIESGDVNKYRNYALDAEEANAADEIIYE